MHILAHAMHPGHGGYMQSATNEHNDKPMDLITLNDAAAMLPGKRTYAMLYHWARRGMKTKTGRIVLRHTRVGRTLYTRMEWVEQFCKDYAAQTARDSISASIHVDDSLARLKEIGA